MAAPAVGYSGLAPNPAKKIEGMAAANMTNWIGL